MGRGKDVSAGLLVFRRNGALEVLLAHPGVDRMTDIALSRRLYAGCDAFVMPSRFAVARKVLSMLAPTM